ncbi:MAG: hypothetical protein ACTHXA_06505 [Gulosibacter sp.]|uniref:hypothetical protein n=1 Tax=Gulosibacter sp. TaxID=2817531 RepID=UPI003F924623
MPNSSAVAEIREALLTSPYIDEVLKVQVEGDSENYTVVGIRVSLTNVPELAALPPVLAEFRALVRGVVGADVSVFVEPDITEPNRHDVPTESIVIRSWD